jgi:hypothetical protein
VFSIGTRNVASPFQAYLKASAALVAFLLFRSLVLFFVRHPKNRLPLLLLRVTDDPTPICFFFFLVFSFSSHFFNSCLLSRLLSRPRLLPCPSSSIHFLPRPRSINDPVNRPLCRRLPYDPASKASQGWPFFWFSSLSNNDPTSKRSSFRFLLTDDPLPRQTDDPFFVELTLRPRNGRIFVFV